MIEGEITVRWDEASDRIILETPNGHIAMTPERFSIFCQQGQRLVSWARTVRDIKEFVSALILINDAEKFLKEKREK